MLESASAGAAIGNLFATTGFCFCWKQQHFFARIHIFGSAFLLQPFQIFATIVLFFATTILFLFLAPIFDFFFVGSIFLLEPLHFLLPESLICATTVSAFATTPSLDFFCRMHLFYL
ncbi:hypothetical protein VPH35_137554 [Triticum aestivum]